jgi:hypothetical protein
MEVPHEVAAYGQVLFTTGAPVAQVGELFEGFHPSGLDVS